MKFDPTIKPVDIIAMIALFAAIGGYFNTRNAVLVAERNAKQEFERWNRVIGGIKDTSDRLEQEAVDRRRFQISSMGNSAEVHGLIGEAISISTDTSNATLKILTALELKQQRATLSVIRMMDHIVAGNNPDYSRMKNAMKVWLACNYEMLAIRDLHGSKLQEIDDRSKGQREVARKTLGGEKYAEKLIELNTILRHEISQANATFGGVWRAHGEKCAELAKPLLEEEGK